MIAGISKAVTLYLAPVLALTATVLEILAFLAPTLVLSGRVDLVRVVPSVVLMGGRGEVDGPSLFVGSLGACVKSNNDAQLNCTLASVSPQYDLSPFPSNAPTTLLYAPSPSTPIFISIALALNVVFLLTFTLISFREKMPGKIGKAFESPLMQSLSAGMGFLGFMTGLTAFMVLRMWFGKTVQDFNTSIQNQGSQGPKLIAETSNAFTMVWVAHAFWAVPLMISLTKHHVKSGKA
ncbi:hypothetical protein Agabi119p4_970 [Agaricus bisporus var. burnettii]|uniref:Uncharacterized protein n=1 Tax=Agaricus bisporus var. burnettii TaxID=192524 RepID=A0A8H7FBX3_AGABI|nr:hypothetical protein Agabi119p4_970 [Agaricus bisporus var. burnettii]